MAVSSLQGKHCHEPPSLSVYSTSEGNVSSTRIFGPVASGPKAQMERAASRSQSYFVWKNSPSFFLEERGQSGSWAIDPSFLEDSNPLCPHHIQDNSKEGRMAARGQAKRSKWEPWRWNLSNLFQVIWTTSFSMSSARPFSRGSAIMVILFLVRKDRSSQKGSKDEQG